jgi:transposase
MATSHGEHYYDPSVGTMLALMRYGAGQPLYRMDKWQTHFGVPLPASTQWELIEAASTTPALIYDALIGVAAQGRLLHHDDIPLNQVVPPKASGRYGDTMDGSRSG